MATFILPTISGEDANPNYQFESDLDGVPFRLDFRFNSRSLTWFMNVRDINGVVIRGGIQVVSGWPLLVRMAQISRPAGEILGVPVAENVDAAGLEQLGDEVALTYEGQT